MKTLKKVKDLTIIALIGINVIGLAAFFWARPRAGLYRIGTPFPVPYGYLLDHTFLPPIAAQCYIIRVTADGCPYCRADQTKYIKLVQRAMKFGCEVITLAPKFGQMRPQPGELQLQYVDMTLGRFLNPFLIPQTILLDRRRRVVWYMVGSMDDASLRGALGGLAKFPHGSSSADSGLASSQ